MSLLFYAVDRSDIARAIRVLAWWLHGGEATDLEDVPLVYDDPVMIASSINDPNTPLTRTVCLSGGRSGSSVCVGG